MSDTQNLGLPVVLLSTLWGAVDIVLKAYELINQKRDQILLFIECKNLSSMDPKVAEQCQLCCIGRIRVIN